MGVVGKLKYNFMKPIIVIFILLCLHSCISEREEFISIDLSDAQTLESSEVICEFEEKYPVALAVKDSFAYVIQAKSDTCMCMLNLNTGKVMTSFGAMGHGENDLLNPDFILSTEQTDVLLDVGNLGKLMKVDYDADEGVKLSEYIAYPESLLTSSELNFSENYIVGRKVDAYEKNMFYIYEKNKGNLRDIPCYPELGFPITDYNYFYAPVLALNEKKKRVVAGMYFFDLFQLYDLSGHRINTFSFSEHSIPRVDKKSRQLDLRQGYSGIIRVFPTERYCYMLRMTTGAESSSDQFMLIQVDWDGQLVNSYRFKDKVCGQFYVDEQQRKIYIIKQYINGNDDEIYAIVAYDVN